jgi:hypothetical protein
MTPTSKNRNPLVISPAIECSTTGGGLEVSKTLFASSDINWPSFSPLSFGGLNGAGWTSSESESDWDRMIDRW